MVVIGPPPPGDSEEDSRDHGEWNNRNVFHQTLLSIV